MTNAVERWYHTIELPDGTVTPGRWDTRPVAKRLPFPDLTGKRCLDVGTWDGFWAFEMERRGAAEVVAIDVRDGTRWDWPNSAPDKDRVQWKPADGFNSAREQLRSKVQRIEKSVYDVAELGRFDFAYVGTIIPHLRDPAGAFMALRETVAELISADQVSVSLSLLPFPIANLAGTTAPHWWTPNRRCHIRFITSAGFEIIETGGPYRHPPGPGAKPERFTPAILLSRTFGLAHHYVYAR